MWPHPGERGDADAYLTGGCICSTDTHTYANPTHRYACPANTHTSPTDSHTHPCPAHIHTNPTNSHTHTNPANTHTSPTNGHTYTHPGQMNPEIVGYAGPIGLQCYGLGGDARDHLARSMAAWRKMSGHLAVEGR